MPDIDRRLPSIPEVLELVSLVPSQKPPCPNAARLLQPFIELCRPQWISDFLFTPEPIHLDHFLAPSFASKAFVSAYKTTRIEAANLQPDPEPLYEETHHLDGRYLFLPAFTAGDITLGFGCMEIIASAGPFWHSASTRRCGACVPMRFVRDTKRNTFLEIFDIPQDDGVMVYLTRYLSSTRTHCVTALFTRSQLLASLRQPTSRLFIHNLTSSLRQITEEDQTRTCHICRTPPPTLCHCPFQPSRPSHPFDGRSFADSMQQHLGLHQSLSNKLIFTLGKESRHVVMGSRMLMQGSIDPAFVQRISSLVATQFLNSSSPNPRVLVPLVSDHVEALGDIFTVDESNLAIVHKPSNAKVVNDESMLQTLIDDVIEQQQVGSGTMGDALTYEMAQPILPENDALFDGIDITGDGLSELQALNSGYVFTVSSATDDGLQEDWWAERCNAQTDQVFQETLTPVPPEREEETSRPTVTPQVRERSNVVQDTGSSPATHETPGPDERLIAKRLKAQQRRERNRLCAQRSNLRAKAMRDALKADLQSSKDLLEVLRSKEMALRQENLELRKSIAEQV